MEASLQMEISLKNINLLYKMAFLLGFKNSPGAAIFFFLINQSKIIFLSNGHILGVLFCDPLEMSMP